MRHFLVLLATVACGKSTPSQPNWVDDVEPILAANCVRCHGAYSPGSAPRGFRLDIVNEQALTGGRVAPQHVYGAAAMAPFIAIRAVEHRTMPPIGPELSDRQREILEAWAECAPLAIDFDPGNDCGYDAIGTPEPPEVSFSAPPTADGSATIEVTLKSPRRAQVTGALVADGPAGLITITDDLHSGRNVVEWDTGVLPAGTYMLGYAPDPLAPDQTQALGQIEVDHPGGNVAPRIAKELFGVTFVVPLGEPRCPSPPNMTDCLIRTVPSDEVYVDAEAPYTIELAAFDPDGDALTADVDLVRGSETISIAADAPLNAMGEPEPPITWDPAGVPEATSWRLRVRVSDGTATRELSSDPIIVSHTTSTETCASIRTLFVAKCGQCHGPFGSPDARVVNGPDFTRPGCEDVVALRGIVYRRAVQKREMPPPSALGEEIGGALLTDAERQRIAEWILAGAPL